MTVTRPVAVWTLPIAWGGGTPIAWAQPPTAPSSLRIADATEHATPPCAVGCLAVGAIHAHCFSPVIYNETLCRYTSRNFPLETASETLSARKIGAIGRF